MQNSNLATKDDLKKELENVATKDDLKRFATKDDLKRFATKDDLGNLEKKFDKMLVRQINLEGKVEGIEENMMTKDDKDEILTAIDGITQKHKDFDTEKTSNQGAHDRFQKKIDDHGKRINNLELKTA